jgi:hypothetical protein
MDILASPSASGKAVTSTGRLLNTGGAPPRCSNDGVKDSTGEDAARDRRPERRDPSIPKLFTGGTASRWSFSLPLISSNLASD